MLENLKQRARQLKTELIALAIAYRDPRTPWYAKVCAALVVGYAFSPIDLIPDPIPVLGYLDDLVLVPLGIWIALRLVPDAIMTDAREQARAQARSAHPANWFAALAILALWLLLAYAVVRFLL